MTLAQAASLDVIRAPVAQGLYEVVYSARQHAVYVASAGGRGNQADPPRILRLDPDSLAVVAEIPLPHGGYGLALDDEAGRLYVGHARDASVTVVDIAQGRVSGTVTLAEQIADQGADGEVQWRYPHHFRELVLDSKGRRLYAPGLWFQDSALYVVDTTTLSVERIVPGFGFVATGITRDDERGVMYVSNMQGQLYTVDARTLAVGTPVEVQADQLLNLAYDGRQHRLLAIDQGEPHFDAMRRDLGGLSYEPRGPGHRVVVMDPRDGRVTNRVAAGQGPVALLLDEQRHRLYVTHRLSGRVTVHDSRNYAWLQTAELPTHPNSLALNPRTGDVYVTIKRGENDRLDAPEHVARLSIRSTVERPGTPGITAPWRAPPESGSK